MWPGSIIIQPSLNKPIWYSVKPANLLPEKQKEHDRQGKLWCWFFGTHKACYSFAVIGKVWISTSSSMRVYWENWRTQFERCLPRPQYCYAARSKDYWSSTQQVWVVSFWTFTLLSGPGSQWFYFLFPKLKKALGGQGISISWNSSE